MFVWVVGLNGRSGSLCPLCPYILQSMTKQGHSVQEDEIEGVCSEIRQAVGRTSLLRSNLMVKVPLLSNDTDWDFYMFLTGSGCKFLNHTAGDKKPCTSPSKPFSLVKKMMTSCLSFINSIQGHPGVNIWCN